MKTEALEKVEPAELAASTEIEQSRAIAETQAAMIIAKRFPRDPVKALDKILNACTRPRLAESALYEYARGGTAITGPSIRLAEAVAQSWGNLQFGIRELSQRAGESEVEAFAWDIETNVRETKTFYVKHKRHTKKGSYNLTDPRDIYEMVANQGARRLRACILGVIPGDIVEEAQTQCELTLKAAANVTPERIASMVEKFKVLGVTKLEIETRIQRRVDTMTAGQMVLLGKIYNSIQDGMSAPGEWFQVEETKGPTETLKEKLKAKEAPPLDEKSKALSDLVDHIEINKDGPMAQPTPSPGMIEGSGRLLPCPNMKEDDRIYESECTDCKDREGCPTHQEGEE